MFRFNLNKRIIVEEVLVYFYLYQYLFLLDELVCFELFYIEDEVGNFEEDVLKGWIIEECFLFDSDNSFVDVIEQEFVVF